MARKSYNNPSFIDSFLTEKHTENKFLQQVNQILDWSKLSKLLEKYYKKGKNITGRPAYDPLLLFKMTLLQTWFDFSDSKTEQHLNQNLAFKKFCNLAILDAVPDHTAIARFRQIMTDADVYTPLLDEVTAQLEQHGAQVKKGYTVDASITTTQRKPSGPSKYELSQDCMPIAIDHRTKSSLDVSSKLNESVVEKPVNSNTPTVTKVVHQSVDQQAAWTKKNNQFKYGYKRHYLVNTATTLVKAVLTTAANVHDSQALEGLLDKSHPPPKTPIYADKAYFGQKSHRLLEERQLKNRIQDRATRGRPLTTRQKYRNKLISRLRCNVERVFGGIKGWFKSTSCRYVGQDKAHYQHTLEAIAYNLKIMPGLIKRNMV